MFSSKSGIDISHETLLPKMELFLSRLGAGEALPHHKLCNGYAFMYMRAAKTLKTKTAYFQRLHRLAKASTEDVIAIADILKQYKNNYNSISIIKNLQRNLKNKSPSKETCQAYSKEIETLAMGSIKDNPKETDMLLYAQDLYAFISSLLLISALGHGEPILFNEEKPIACTDYTTLLSILPLDSDTDTSEEYHLYDLGQIHFSFNSEELSQQLEIIPTNSFIVFSNHLHNSVAKKLKDSYEWYDNASKEGIESYSSSLTLLARLQQAHFKKSDHSSKELTIGYRVFSYEENKYLLKPNEFIKNLLSTRKKEKSIDHQGPDGVGALYLATLAGDVATTKTLLEYKANPNIQTDDKETPGYVAAKYGFTAIMQLLKDKGARFDIANQNEVTPAFVAAQKGKLAAMQLLAKYGVDVNKPTKGGWTPAHVAIKFAHAPILDFFLQNGLCCTKPIRGTQTIVQAVLQREHKSMLDSIASAAIARGDTSTIMQLIEVKPTASFYFDHTAHITLALATDQWAIAALILININSKKELSKKDKQLIKKNIPHLVTGSIKIFQEMKTEQQKQIKDHVINGEKALGELLRGPKHQLFKATAKYNEKVVSIPAYQVLSAMK